jgi:hypothetical protein
MQQGKPGQVAHLVNFRSYKMENEAAEFYAKTAAQINEMVVKLQEYGANLYDGVDPDDIGWEHIGDIERVRSMLADLMPIINKK